MSLSRVYLSLLESSLQHAVQGKLQLTLIVAA